MNRHQWADTKFNIKKGIVLGILILATMFGCDQIADAATAPTVKQAISGKWYSVKDGKCYLNTSSKTWYTDGKIVYKETSILAPGKCN